MDDGDVQSSVIDLTIKEASDDARDEQLGGADVKISIALKVSRKAE